MGMDLALAKMRMAVSILRSKYKYNPLNWIFSDTVSGVSRTLAHTTANAATSVQTESAD